MRNLTRSITIGLAVALAYVVAARLGFRVALVAEQVTMVWAPTGIAQAALLLWGLKLSPAIWLAAFAVNAGTNVPIGTAAGIATGNLLEAAVAAWVLTRIVGFDPAFNRVRDAIAFIGIAAAASTMISATLGVAMLCLGGVQAWSGYWNIWLDWWLGDAIGSLVVAPAILTTLRARSRPTRQRLWETTAWVVAVMTITALVFGRGLTPGVGQLPLAFIVFPFVIAAAVRLGQPATALVLLGTAAVTLAITIRGDGPFVNSPFHERLVLVQVFMGALAGSGILLAAAITERWISERRRAAVYGVAEVLARSANLEQAAPRILRLVGESLDWMVGAVWLVDEAIGRLRCTAVWSRDAVAAPGFIQLTKETTFPPGLGLPGRVWATQQPAWIEDVVDDRNFPRAPVARREGLHGAFAFPIRSGDQFYGVVEFFNHSVAAPDQDLLVTMATLGTEIGQFIRQKRIEAMAVESERGTRAILETALDAVITMNHHGHITEFNPAAERMFGHHRADVIGRDLAGLIIPSSLRDAHRGGLHTYLVTGEGPFIDRRVETTAIRADGTELPVEVSITRVPTDPPMFTGFVRDMTERAEAERERQRLLERAVVSRREAEEANRAKDEFLATLSHELRTPLNTIVGWARMLLDGNLDEATARRALRSIDRNAQAQVQLVADILDVSRIITGKLSLDVHPLDLGVIISTVLAGARPAAAAKGVHLQSRLAPSARVTRGDPQRIQQVVWNLVSNAMKFTPQGGRIEIELAECRPMSVCIKVTDTGIGIAPEFLGRVFERFSQADSSSTREYGGLGLGLAIVRHLVELHGGTVRVESEGAGKGTCFIVELPRVIDEDSPAQMRPAALEPDVLVGAGADQNRYLSGCRVLVVEDEDDERELIATVLTRAGATVDLATSVEHALAVLNKMRPDVLLSDIGFVRVDGYRLIREIRKQDAGGTHLPALAITAYARPEDRERVLAAGFDRYLAKPVAPQAIIEAVQALWRA